MAKQRRASRHLFEWYDCVEDLYDYARTPASRAARQSVRPEALIVVMNDWPEIVPIWDSELRVMEGHFAQELDEIFGPRA